MSALVYNLEGEMVKWIIGLRERIEQLEKQVAGLAEYNQLEIKDVPAQPVTLTVGRKKVVVVSREIGE